jgi:hypothetical protein
MLALYRLIPGALTIALGLNKLIGSKNAKLSSQDVLANNLYVTISVALMLIGTATRDDVTVFTILPGADGGTAP